MAWVTIANVRGPRGPVGPQGGGNWRGPLPVGANLNNYIGSANRGDWGAGEDSTGTQLASLINLPELRQGTLSVESTDIGFSTQTFKPFNRDYYYFRSQKSLATATWNPWKKISAVEDRGAIPMNYNLNWMQGADYRGTWWVDNAGGVNQIDTLLSLPEKKQGTLHIAVTDNGFTSQLYRSFNGSIWYRGQRTLGQNIWLDWVNLAGGSGGSNVKHAMLEQELRREYSQPALGNAVPVTLIFDHGTNVFKSDILPSLTANGLEATLALNSDMYNPADPRYSHNSNTTWSEINGWPVEISNHGKTHGNQTSEAQLEEEIVGGLNALKANLPSKKILTWTQTGQGAGAWMGFENGATAESWVASPAGRIILDNHAASTGALTVSKPALYDMTGEIHQGVWGYWIDSTAGIATAKTRVAEAIAQGKGVIIRCHPEVLGGSGNATVAEVKAFLVWLAAEQTAGRVKSLKFGQWAITSTALSGPRSTGWKPAALINGWTGTAEVRRDANTVTLRLKNLNGSASTGTNAVQLPLGYQIRAADFLIPNGAGVMRMGVSASAQPFLTQTYVQGSYLIEVRFTTEDAWPV